MTIFPDPKRRAKDRNKVGGLSTNQVMWVFPTSHWFPTLDKNHLRGVGAGVT